MNTSHDVIFAPARADELAGLLDGLVHWLTSGERRALADLEAHLADHATQHGGTFDTSGYLYGIDSILESQRVDLDRQARKHRGRRKALEDSLQRLRDGYLEGLFDISEFNRAGQA